MSPLADAEVLGLALGKQSVTVESGAAGPCGEIDVVSLLADLAGAGTEHLDERGREALDMLCRKISVAKQVVRSYRDGWRKAADPEPLEASDWSLLIAVLLARVEIAGSDASELAFAVKYLNAALEALDLADTFEEEVLDRARLRVQAEAILESLARVSHQSPAAAPHAEAGLAQAEADRREDMYWTASEPFRSSTSSEGAGGDTRAMKTLPLTVLVHEGPIARAYLSRLRREGLRPERILLMVYSHHPATGRPIGRWLPRPLRMAYARKCQDAIQNFWPRRLRFSHPALLDAMTRGLEGSFDSPADWIDEIAGGFRYEDYGGSVEQVLVRNLRDPALADALTGSGPIVLFTGGGLVPAGLLDIPGARFLHVHPGRLPFVRGADGALWSALVRGQAGASCFYLATGIDTGEVISARDFPLPRFDLEGCQRPDDATLYRALFSFYDPLLRAECLARMLLENGGDVARLRGIPQDPSAGVTYHFMHPELRRVALGRLFVGERVGR